MRRITGVKIVGKQRMEGLREEVGTSGGSGIRLMQGADALGEEGRRRRMQLHDEIWREWEGSGEWEQVMGEWRMGASDGEWRMGASDGEWRMGASDGEWRMGASDGEWRMGASDGEWRMGASDGGVENGSK